MIFLTWHLWRTIRYPKRQNPIFKVGQRRWSSSEAPNRLLQMFQILGALIIMVLIGLFPAVVGFGLVGLFIGLPTFVILFSATILGTYSVVIVTSTLASSQQQQRFDLMQLTEHGSIGTAFQIAVGALHRNNWLMRFYQVVSWVVRIVLVLIMIASILLGINLLTTGSVQLQQQQILVLRDSLALCVVVLTFWLDFVQSILVALLLGILIPTMLNERIFVRGIVPLVYLGMQIMTYLGIALIYILSRVLLFGIFGESFWAFFVILLLIPISLYVAREVLFRIMVALILRYYDASQIDFQYLMKPS